MFLQRIFFVLLYLSIRSYLCSKKDNYCSIDLRKKTEKEFLPILFLFSIESTVLSINIRVSRVFLDKLASRFNIVAHQHRENFVGLGCILDCHLLQQSVRRVHRRFPKLFGIHFTQTFVTLRVQGRCVLVASHVFVDESLTLLLGVAIFREFLVGAFVERRRGDVEVSALNPCKTV